MSPLKYRQAIFVKWKFIKWYYWGFIEEQVTDFGNLTFVAPEMNLSTIEEAYKNSYQCVGVEDKNGKEIYKGDHLKYPKGIFSVYNDTIGTVYCRNGCFVCSCSEYSDRIEYLTEAEVIGNIIENPIGESFTGEQAIAIVTGQGL